MAKLWYQKQQRWPENQGKKDKSGQQKRSPTKDRKLNESWLPKATFQKKKKKEKQK